MLLANMFAQMFSPLFAQSDEEAIVMVIVMLMVAVFAVVMLAIWIFILYFLSTCFARIPRQYRQLEPGMVWLLLIPCFPIVWNFFVYPKLAESYQRYFWEQGRTDVGDCGQSLGLWYSICTVASIVPYIGAIPGMIGLVLLILFLVKANELKKQIPEYADQPY